MIVRSTIDLGHNLGLQVVAEGVEDQEILDALRELGCDVGQGFHIGRPMARGAVRAMDDIASRSRVTVPTLTVVGRAERDVVPTAWWSRWP